ncbi:hypothetical protein GQ53DRAFT_336387 [Thozetella sp. PMI_491]|nr:hypothetical protein GQ53DRAFT_336387 [Thozetella sp. PMI_491]
MASDGRMCTSLLATQRTDPGVSLEFLSAYAGSWRGYKLPPSLHPVDVVPKCPLYRDVYTGRIRSVLDARLSTTAARATRRCLRKEMSRRWRLVNHAGVEAGELLALSVSLCSVQSGLSMSSICGWVSARTFEPSRVGQSHSICWRKFRRVGRRFT